MEVWAQNQTSIPIPTRVTGHEIRSLNDSKKEICCFSLIPFRIKTRETMSVNSTAGTIFPTPNITDQQKSTTFSNSSFFNSAVSSPVPSQNHQNVQPISPASLNSSLQKTNRSPQNTVGGATKLVGPTAILTPCSNSHPFEERRIPVTRSEEEAVKIGRSVVRLQPSPNNAIFDCKVLSRNHAILWMNGDGQFLIKDTRSSNGTFINNERLSASGEESEHRELFSGDIIQLGVEIVDQAKKVASGCVTCIVRLINELGEECAGRPQTDQFAFSNQQVPLNFTLVRNDKLFILDQYIKEAKHRENVQRLWLLGQKLQLLEEQLRVAQESLQCKWQEHVSQELLLSRIEILESQLAFYANKKTPTSTNSSEVEERLTMEMKELVDDRGRAEQAAKQAIKSTQEHMQETSMRLHDAEMGLMNVEEECSFLRQRCSEFESHMARQRDDYDALLEKYSEVCAKLCAAEKASVDAANDVLEEEHKQQMNGEGEQASSEGMVGGNVVEWIEVPPAAPAHPNEMELSGDGNNRQTLSAANAIEGVKSDLDIGVDIQRCEGTEKELVQLRAEYNELWKKYNSKTTFSATNDGTGINEAPGKAGSSPSDFQLFLLSAFPFLLFFLLLLSPVFYLFGFPRSTAVDRKTDFKLTKTEEGREDDQK